VRNLQKRVSYQQYAGRRVCHMHEVVQFKITLFYGLLNFNHGM